VVISDCVEHRVLDDAGALGRFQLMREGVNIGSRSGVVLHDREVARKEAQRGGVFGTGCEENVEGAVSVGNGRGETGTNLNQCRGVDRVDVRLCEPGRVAS
jgi:hypothetical protein